MLQFYHTTIKFLEVEIRANRGRGSTVPFCGGGNNGSFLSIFGVEIAGLKLGDRWESLWLAPTPIPIDLLSRRGLPTEMHCKQMKNN